MPKISIIHAALFATVLPLSAIAAESLIVPLPDNNTNSQQDNQQQRALQQIPDYQISKGKVTLQVPKTYLNTPFILQFPDNSHRKIIFTKRKDSNGVTSLWGHTIDSQALNTTLTVGQQNYFLTVNDYQRNETFNIVGQVADGVGTYQRFDNKKYRSHIKHATPLTDAAIVTDQSDNQPN